MVKYIVKRIGSMILTIFIVSFIVFTMLYLTPGDPATQALGSMSTEEAREAFRYENGLKDPFLVQYFNFIKGFVTKGSLGISFVKGRPVMGEILEVFPNTFALAGLSVVIATIFGITLGVIATVKQGTFVDGLVTVTALLGVSAPVFWYGLLMILFFSVNLGWFPPSGFDTPAQMILPVTALAFQSMASITRTTRSSMLEVIRMDYIDTARSKGQKEIVVITRHALRNALIPIMTVIGLAFANLLAGVLILEVIFSIPGLGRLMIDGIKMRDYPIVLGGVFFMSMSVTVVNLVTDIGYAIVDPRVAKS